MTELISYQEALRTIIKKGLERSAAFLSQSETLPLQQAVSRFCSEVIYGHEAVPSFDNSSMDGFAVRAEETLHASAAQPIIFKIHGRILAGDQVMSEVAATPRVCYEIMTGAPIPLGFDAVYKIEDVVVGAGGEIAVTFPLEKFENFRAAGSDFKLGQKLFDRGTRLMPEQIMALASVGVTHVRTVRRPRVAFVSTGSELAAPDAKVLLPGKIRNSTTSYLLSAADFFGAEVRSYGIVVDQREKFTESLAHILGSKPDIILTTGAVSKGSHDFIPEVITALGAEKIFHNVAIRPGKPQLFAQFKDGPAFFGLPGNPISSVIGLRFFVSAYLRALAGQGGENPLVAVLKEAVAKPEGLRCFYKAHVEIKHDGVLITSLNGQPSFMVSSLLHANAWLVLNEEPGALAAGQHVEFYPIYPLNYDFSLAFQGAVAVSENCC